MTPEAAGLARRVGRAATLAVLAVGITWCLIPLYVMTVMALKSPSEVATTSIWSLPHRPTLGNFQEVLGGQNVVFWVSFKNTVLIAVINTLGVVLTSSLAAYAFGRLRFAGRDRLFIVLLSTMMLPSIVTMIPSYVVFAKVGWVNTFLPLTVPAFFGGGAFNIFLLRQFFGSIPRELDEAAVLDGAGALDDLSAGDSAPFGASTGHGRSVYVRGFLARLYGALAVFERQREADARGRTRHLQRLAWREISSDDGGEPYGHAAPDF